MNTLVKALKKITAEVDYDKEYPLAGKTIDGLEVTKDIPNQSSIAATYTDYEILDGIREVSMADWNPQSHYYAKRDLERCKELAHEIRDNSWIDPLIVAIEDGEPYVLEGGHRLVALHYLGVKSFPAMIVIDKRD